MVKCHIVYISRYMISVGWLCFMSHRHRGHLEMAPPFTVPCEGHMKLCQKSNPGPSLRHASSYNFSHCKLKFYTYTPKNYLDRDPEDVPAYTGHSLLNTTKCITLFFIVQSLLHRDPPNIWIRII